MRSRVFGSTYLLTTAIDYLQVSGVIVPDVVEQQSSTGPGYRKKAKRYRGGKWVTRTHQFRIKPGGSPTMPLTSSLRLFALRRNDTRKLAKNDKGDTIYFNSKRQAKTARNQTSAGTGVNHSVVFGPDHKKASPRGEL